MELSADPGLLLKEFTDRCAEVRNLKELESLLNTAIKSDKKKEFLELIFTARYVNGLKKVLGNRTIGSDEFIRKTFEEFKKNLEKVIDQLKAMTGDFSKEEKEQFEARFFALTETSVPNVMELIDDLSSFKHFMNVTSRKL